MLNNSTNQPNCFHCGLPAFGSFRAEIQGEVHDFCCIGCQSVAQTIHGSGLDSFYRYRDSQLEKPEQYSENFQAYDLDEVQHNFVFPVAGAKKRVRLYIGGISCAACAWLIEHYLVRLHGIDRVRVNVSSMLCEFEWDSECVKLSKVFAALGDIGYRAKPGVQGQRQSLRKAEQSYLLRRMGLAGLGMMQVGMVAIALHAGGIQGIEANWQHFLRWVSLVFATPVMLYSAQPFFVNAWRAIKFARVNMDVSVSLALALAFTASIIATISNTGDVYFDSVSMFTFFLLLGRYLEMRARHTSARETEALSNVLPFSVERVKGFDPTIANPSIPLDSEQMPLSQLKASDYVRVHAGDVVPCDGLLKVHQASMDESLLTGESRLVQKKWNDDVFAGSVVGDTSIIVEATSVAENTKLAAIEELVIRASAQKPVQQKLADAVAAKFITCVLVLCLAVFAYWYVNSREDAFWIVLSVLVITCPCALSLATPAALSAGLNGLRRRGLLVLSSEGLTNFAKINHIVFDKTGTLTQGEARVLDLIILGKHKATHQQSDMLHIVSALELHSRHPLASAFQHVQTPLHAKNVVVEPGLGISGKIAFGDKIRSFRFGSRDFACPNDPPDFPRQHGNWHLLSRDEKPMAWIKLGDDIREDAVACLDLCEKEKIRVSILSGDRQKHLDDFVSNFLPEHIIRHLYETKGELLPDQKLKKIYAKQQSGEYVMMVGDGINDVPVLALANFSVAMNSASQLARINADAVLLNQNLVFLLEARHHAKRVVMIIRQNLTWALAYNTLALPIAAMGYIPPYLAAAGMSLSSLMVVLNSLRLRHV